MNWYEQMLISINRLKKALGVRKNIKSMSPSEVMNFYETLCDMKDKWEEDNQQELRY
ncbi:MULTISPECIES: hypothetical protein [unclassified Clostridium]|uniref:hypothetical protein n=1 Tax=unclassified Clostridium TaxID=2614128 RepID=UPI0025C607B7|nr:MULTISPECIES: hypothetical protein [unclassified Clostridium]